MAYTLNVTKCNDKYETWTATEQFCSATTSLRIG